MPTGLIVVCRLPTADPFAVSPVGSLLKRVCNQLLVSCYSKRPGSGSAAAAQRWPAFAGFSDPCPHPRNRRKVWLPISPPAKRKRTKERQRKKTSLSRAQAHYSSILLRCGLVLIFSPSRPAPPAAPQPPEVCRQAGGPSKCPSPFIVVEAPSIPRFSSALSVAEPVRGIYLLGGGVPTWRPPAGVGGWGM